jgi:hypothetical protein
MKKISLITLVVLPTLLLAQWTKSFKNDKNTFTEKSIEYDKWLKSAGMGHILYVKRVRTADSTLSLDLGFSPTTDGDSALTLWDGLKTAFEKQDRGMAFEDALFRKMLYFMEIEPQQGYVQVFNSFEKDACFSRSIKYENRKVFVKNGNCRSTPKPFMVDTKDLTNMRTIKKGDFNKKATKEMVFERIKKYVEARYANNKCEIGTRKPSLEWPQSVDNLRFIVTDLCQEVIPEEPNPWWCRVLEPACTSCSNCRKREMLDVYINYTETPTGYQINMEVYAKFGSGWYKDVPRGAYKNMEIDYKDRIDQYAGKFRDELIQELKK